MSASGTGPPHMPEWMGCSSARTVTTTSASPRSEYVRPGTPTCQFVASVRTMTSASSVAAWAARNSGRCGDPISSSPSATTLTFTGSAPRVASHARVAVTCTITPALSSADPRP